VNISIISIAKKERSLYDPLYQEQMKMISRFAKVDDIELFPKEIVKRTLSAPKHRKRPIPNCYHRCWVKITRLRYILRVKKWIVLHLVSL
jgi:hypothetical protein